MAIQFEKDKKIFVLQTKNTTYQMQIDAYGYLLHLYYGAKVIGTTEHLLTYYDRGFSGNPYEAGSDRTYSLDALPQEYPSIGTGDFRKVAFNVQNADGTEWCNLHYEKHEIYKGKYALKGLPAVYATEKEAQTLVITLVDSVSKVHVELYYGVLEDADIILRPYRIAKECGCKFYLGSDAHSPGGLDAAKPIFEKVIDLLELTEEDKFVISGI